MEQLERGEEEKNAPGGVQRGNSGTEVRNAKSSCSDRRPDRKQPHVNGDEGENERACCVRGRRLAAR